MIAGANRTTVEGAVAAAKAHYADQFKEHGLVLQADQMRFEYGSWLVPAYCAASPGIRGSYELHRLVEAVEEFVSERSGELVTVFLEPASAQRGAA